MARFVLFYKMSVLKVLMSEGYFWQGEFRPGLFCHVNRPRTLFEDNSLCSYSQ